MSAPRPPITCHVLDTTTGRPAANIPVTLSFHSTGQEQSRFEYGGITDSDGRVTTWGNSPDVPALAEVFKKQDSGNEVARWSLVFLTGQYYEKKGIQPFFPEVELKFVVRNREEHYHVPLLLGPYNYTTYRGS